MTAELRLSRSELWQPNRNKNKLVENTVKAITAAFAFVSVIATFGIVLTLIVETIHFFGVVSPLRFISETRWTPLFSSAQFGIIVLISATLRTAGIAILVALPLGLLSAICLSEYAGVRVRKILKPLLEILAGIPTVVFGYFALTLVTPQLLQPLIPGLSGLNALSAGLVLGLAIMPLVTSLSEDAIYAVPRSLRDGAYALGATKRETIIAVVLPAALSGIVSSLILAVSRAIGETMIVTLAAGQTPNLGIDPTVAVLTMTAYIVQIFKGDAPAGSIAYLSAYAVGMTLFVMTLLLNIFSFWFVRRFREKYE
ncbi:MAG: phosphate ABC transporter permease subunit PstC [Chloroflexaceae bacterium]|nr:phosphate ABC transporter permease subunit PstC [Chloroflexaceae bacterium]